jgi:hypothetical protein
MLANQASALDINHCPTPERIKVSKGLYTSSTTGQKGQWVGMLPNAEPAPITRFVKAVYFTSEQSRTDQGILAKCLYKTSTKKLVDLRFRPNSQDEVAVRLLDLGNWKHQPHASGLTQYICTSKQEGGCVFAVITPPVSGE